MCIRDSDYYDDGGNDDDDDDDDDDEDDEDADDEDADVNVLRFLGALFCGLDGIGLPCGARTVPALVVVVIVLPCLLGKCLPLHPIPLD
eukprot:9206005-Pyramimonas_sp.AAC.1